MTLRNYAFGEGMIRMNKATNYLIKQARRAQTMWGLSNAAVVECLERATNAEKHGKLMYNRDTARSLDPMLADFEQNEIND